MTESVVESAVEPVVEIIGLSKRFGAGVLAVDDLTFSVVPGSL